MLTRVERQLLKGARYLLQSRARMTVCGGIRAALVVDAHFNEVARARTKLLEYVSVSLDLHPSLGHWLERRDGKLNLDEENLRMARIMWITWMLGEIDVSHPPTRNLIN